MCLREMQELKEKAEETNLTAEEQQNLNGFQEHVKTLQNKQTTFHAQAKSKNEALNYKLLTSRHTKKFISMIGLFGKPFAQMEEMKISWMKANLFDDCGGVSECSDSYDFVLI